MLFKLLQLLSMHYQLSIQQILLRILVVSPEFMVVPGLSYVLLVLFVVVFYNLVSIVV